MKTEHSYKREFTLFVCLLFFLLVVFLPAKTYATTDIPKMNNPEGAYQESWALTKEHVRYIAPDKYGKYRPTAKLTKGEAAAMIYNLLEVKPETVTYCKDVTEETLHGKEIAALISLNLVSPNSDGYYHPEKNISKADFQKLIAKCMNKEGEFTSTATISRGYAAYLLNKELGRAAPDKNTIRNGENIRIFTDVPTGYAYYYSVMEASIGHTYTIVEGREVWDTYEKEETGFTESGWKVVDGETFYLNPETQLLMRDCKVDGKTLTGSGRYITGDSKLDAQLKKVMVSKTTNSMSNKTKLKKCYEYVYKNCKYRADSLKKIGTRSWDKGHAYKMLRYKKGNCYHFAAAFTYLAQKCGYDAKTVSGYCYYYPAKRYYRHGWTEIKLSDGSKRVCDPEMQYVNYIDKNYRNDYFYRKYNATKNSNGVKNKWHYYYYNKGNRCY